MRTPSSIARLLTLVATLLVPVAAQAAAPDAVNDLFTMDKGTFMGCPACLIANDSDADTPMNQLTTAMIPGSVNPPELAEFVSIGLHGEMIVGPPALYVGNITFLYELSEPMGSSDVATVTINVLPRNIPPLVQPNKSAFLVEDNTLVSNIFHDVQDLDGGPITGAIVTPPTHGQAAFSPSGILYYRPDPNYNGADSLQYVANDGFDDSNIGTLNITVFAANDAPVGVQDAYAVASGGTLTVPAAGGLLANDIDPDGPTLTAVLDDDVSAGTLTLSADGSFTYNAPASPAVVSFSYHPTDGTASGAVTAGRILVGGPAAAADFYTTAPGSTLTVSAPGVMANDVDDDGEPITATKIGDPSNGTLTFNANGSFSYVPDAGFSGTDSFTYRVSDGDRNSNTTTVTITVSGSNTPPVAVNDAYSFPMNAPKEQPAIGGVLANDYDFQNSTLAASVVAAPSNGVLALAPNGAFSYVPNPGFAGVDTFTYRLSDGVLLSNVATVTFTIVSKPSAVADSYVICKNSPLTIGGAGVLANDSDPEGGTLTVIIGQNVEHGSLSIDNDGSFSYIPDTNFTGTDTFTYSAWNGTEASAAAVVTIVVG
jgi:VCBS repeat-containing protein